MKKNHSLPQTPATRFFVISALIILLIIISALTYLFYTSPKIAYVRTLEVVYGYNGMKQAQAEYKVQSEAWQSNIDTLNRRYQDKLTLYKATGKTLSGKEKNELEQELMLMQNDIRKYTSAIQEQAQEKDTKITEAVLGQINAFVEEYAKEQGYDIVFGAQGDGNVMYGVKYYDITDEILTALNKEFKKMP